MLGIDIIDLKSKEFIFVKNLRNCVKRVNSCNEEIGGQFHVNNYLKYFLFYFNVFARC